jgi:hypothetical protein
VLSQLPVVDTTLSHKGCTKAAHSSKQYCGTHGARVTAKRLDVGALSAMEALDSLKSH